MEPLARPFSPTNQTGIPKVFGVLSIVFGALVLLFGLFSSAAGALPMLIGSLAQKAKGDPQAGPMLEAISAVYGGIGAIGVIQVVMSGLLLAIGIGQLRYRRWARAWSV